MQLNKHPVYREYDAGRSERVRYPLSNGKYKLSELQASAKSVLSNLHELSVCRNAGRRPPWWDANDGVAEYLERIPNDLAWIIGKNLLAGIERLDADGVHKRRIALLLPHFATQTDALVEHLQHAHDQLHLHGTTTAYARQGAALSILLVTSVKLVAIVAEALAL